MSTIIAPISQLPNRTRVVREIRELDDVIYGEIPPEHNPDFEFWKEGSDVFPDQDIVLASNDQSDGFKTVGNLHLSPITEEVVQDILKGCYTDECLTPDVIQEAMNKKSLYLHLVSFTIAPKYRNMGYARQMWSCAYELWRKWSVEMITAVVWCNSACRFLSRLPWYGPISQDYGGHPIYTLKTPNHQMPAWGSGTVKSPARSIIALK